MTQFLAPTIGATHPKEGQEGDATNVAPTELCLDVSEEEMAICLTIAVSERQQVKIQDDSTFRRFDEQDLLTKLRVLRGRKLIDFNYASGNLTGWLLVPFNKLKIDRSQRAALERMTSGSTNDERRTLLPALTPGGKSSISFLELREQISKNVDWVSMKLQQLEYADFLRTPYWATVSGRVKLELGNSCVVCGNKSNLQCHHRYYPARGTEILNHLSILTCLCETCHSTFHDSQTR